MVHQSTVMKNVLLFAVLGLSACQRSRPETGKSDAAPTTSISTPMTAAPGPADAATAVHPTYSFDTDTAGAPPKGFVFGRTGSGRPGQWIVQGDTTAKTAPHVLAQLDTDSTNFRFPVAVTLETQPANVSVSVSCKIISGKVDQACGLVLRYRDDNNYLLTRANALEDNVRLYTVKGGKREELASHDVAVTPNAWHDYRFEARGEQLKVWWEGKLVLEHRDDAFMGAGCVGLWTKADSVTYFDDLSVEPLP